MSVGSTLALIFTVLSSVCIVSVIILLGWFLIWKAFLSKFRLVRELLGQTNGEDSSSSNSSGDKSTDAINNSAAHQSKTKKTKKRLTKRIESKNN